MQYAQRVILNEDRTTKPAQLHGILQQAKIFGPISAGHIEYCGNKIRCLDLCSLQRAHYRVLDVGNGRDSRIRPVSSGPSAVDIPAPTSPRAQDRPIKGSYKRDSFRIPSITAQYATNIGGPFYDLTNATVTTPTMPDFLYARLRAYNNYANAFQKD